MAIKTSVPQPDPRVSKKLSPLVLDKSPTINAIIIIPISIPIIIVFYWFRI